METQWMHWRRQLASAGKGGIEIKPIRRDLPYSLLLAISADYTADSFSASLRLSPDAPTVLASFAVEVGEFALGYTDVTLSLTKNQVNSLPSDHNLDGLAEVTFDLLHTPSGGMQQILFGGTIPIIGKVTAGA